jgi:acyl transferase domain-containing protein
VSAFGFGGNNAHVILESTTPVRRPRCPRDLPARRLP